MSLAVKFGDSTNQSSISGAVYFNAVTSYTRSYGGQVTSHPIELGANISDHFISRNSRYNFTGIVSHVDFTTIPDLLKLQEQRVSGPIGDVSTVINKGSSFPTEVRVNSAENLVSQILKNSSLGTWFPVERAGVTVDQNARVNYNMPVENLFKELLTGMYYNTERNRWENRMVTCVLFELNGPTITRSIVDLVCTDCTINEDVSSGEDLALDLVFEQVNFVQLEKAEAPKAAPKSDTQIGTDSKKNKGNQTKTPNDPTDVPKQEEEASVIGLGREGLGGLF